MRTLILASLTWGAAETLLTLSCASSFCRKVSKKVETYSELGELSNEGGLILLSQFVCFYSLHIY